MEDTTVCGSFVCLHADSCELYQKIGFAACSGHPVINPDGECANFLCECCEDRHCFEIGQEFSGAAIH